VEARRSAGGARWWVAGELAGVHRLGARLGLQRGGEVEEALAKMKVRPTGRCGGRR
jgi:hypothetical protein